MSRAPLVELVLAYARPGDRDRLPEHLDDWTLDDLEASGRALIVRSEALGREVIFASTHWRPRPRESRPVYTTAELRALARLRPKAAELRRLHEAREVFGGRILGPAESAPFPEREETSR